MDVLLLLQWRTQTAQQSFILCNVERKVSFSHSEESLKTKGDRCWLYAKNG